jgi:hypothetical protein
MLAIIGTVPVKDFPMVEGEASLEGNQLLVQDKKIPINRGTPALLAAAIKAGEYFNQDHPWAYLVGDIGLGDGSRTLYQFLENNLPSAEVQVLTFHYLQPDVDWHNKVLFAIDDMKSRPALIADAGFMYAAKMSGQAGAYDFFTPDAGELSFLADEQAPHPFYTRGFILHEENKIPDLISRAYEHQNAARYLLVKGKKDYVADQKGVHSVIDHPSEESLEAIGGTGDTLTGILSVLIRENRNSVQSATIAARVNRWAGAYAEPNPASQVSEIIQRIPQALEKVFSEL